MNLLNIHILEINQWAYTGNKSWSTYTCPSFECGSYGIITDEENGYIYVLGGNEHPTDIYRIDVSGGPPYDDSPGVVVQKYHLEKDPNVKKLNFSLSLPIYTTTLLNKQNGRIYAFRINYLNTNDSVQIAFTDIAEVIINTNLKPETSQDTNINDYNNDNFLTSTIGISIGIIIIGLICVCCTIGIGLCIMKKMKQKQSNHSSKEHLMKVKSDSVNEHSNMEQNDDDKEIECVEMIDMKKDINMKKQQKMKVNSIMEKLSDAKVDDLYQTYLRSKLECLEQCEELGLLDEMIEELFALFERYQAL